LIYLDYSIENKYFLLFKKVFSNSPQLRANFTINPIAIIINLAALQIK